MNARALTALRTWAQEFPKRTESHAVFPSEKVGFSGNEEIVSVFDTDPSAPITGWKANRPTTLRHNSRHSRTPCTVRAATSQLERACSCGRSGRELRSRPRRPRPLVRDLLCGTFPGARKGGENNDTPTFF